MGGSASTTVDVNETNDTFVTMQQTCQSAEVSTQSIHLAIHMENCDYSTINLGNSSTTRFVCNIDQSATAIQSNMADVNATSKAGLLSVATTDVNSTANNTISNYLGSQCGKTENRNQLIDTSIECINSDHDMINAYNVLDSDTYCNLVANSNTDQSNTANIVAKSSGFDPTGIVAIIIFAVVAIAVVAIVVGLIYKVLTARSAAAAGGVTATTGKASKGGAKGRPKPAALAPPPPGPVKP